MVCEATGRVSTRARLIHNAVEIASEARALSHGDVTLEMLATLEKQALELVDRWETANAGEIARQLLQMLRKEDRPKRRRQASPTF